jgi:hypothetical protein
LVTGRRLLFLAVSSLSMIALPPDVDRIFSHKLIDERN